MHENEILLLIEKYLAGTTTTEEKKKLWAWYRSYDQSEIEIQLDSEKEQDEIKYKLLQKLKVYIGEARPAAIEQSIERNFKKRRALRWAAAASVILFLATGYWLLVQGPSESSNGAGITGRNNTITTKPGFKTEIALPDGSTVWLNADSKITYDEYFGGAQREVFLTGEAFFNVARDNARPFIVHTRYIDLKVLGTAFNVRAYENEEETETALAHGSIEVTVKNNPGKKITLKPSEKLVVRNQMTDDTQIREEKPREEEPLIAVSKMHYYGKDSSAIETSWVKNRLAFSKERLDQIALKIGRWFNVKVIITDESLKDEKYNGLFDDETLEEVMEALRVAGNFHYTIKEGEVFISR